MHLATQVWVRQYGNAREVAEKSIRTVADVFPSDNYANQAVWSAYLPHALQLLEGKQVCELEKGSKLSLLVRLCLQVDDRIIEAVKWSKESYDQR